MGKDNGSCRLADCASRAVGVSSNCCNWYIAIVKNNTEKSSSKKLMNLGYNVFLPVQEKVCFWKDGRKKKRDSILFPGLVFICLTENQRKEVVTLPYISRFMVNRAGSIDSSNRNPIAVIPKDQIDRLKFMLGDKNSIVNIEALNLKTGDKVRVVRGSLRGLEGNIYNKEDGDSYIVIRIDNLCCASVRASLNDVVLI